MTRLLLVRHGQTDAAVAGRTQGRVDNLLNATGRRQAEALAVRLGRERPRALYASPAVRAIATATPLATALGIPVTPDPRLLEMDYGVLDDLTGVELRARHPEFMARWAAEDPTALRMPGGETMGEVQARLEDVVADIAARHPGETVALFSHGFAIRAYLCAALGLPLSAFRRIRVDLASYSVVELAPDGPIVVQLNEVCHLAD